MLDTLPHSHGGKTLGEGESDAHFTRRSVMRPRPGSIYKRSGSDTCNRHGPKVALINPSIIVMDSSNQKAVQTVETPLVFIQFLLGKSDAERALEGRSACREFVDDVDFLKLFDTETLRIGIGSAYPELLLTGCRHDGSHQAVERIP